LAVDVFPPHEALVCLPAEPGGQACMVLLLSTKPWANEH